MWRTLCPTAFQLLPPFFSTRFTLVFTWWRCEMNPKGFRERQSVWRYRLCIRLQGWLGEMRWRKLPGRWRSHLSHVAGWCRRRWKARQQRRQGLWYVTHLKGLSNTLVGNLPRQNICVIFKTSWGQCNRPHWQQFSLRAAVLGAPSNFFFFFLFQFNHPQSIRSRLHCYSFGAKEKAPNLIGLANFKYNFLTLVVHIKKKKSSKKLLHFCYIYSVIYLLLIVGEKCSQTDRETERQERCWAGTCRPDCLSWMRHRAIASAFHNTSTWDKHILPPTGKQPCFCLGCFVRVLCGASPLLEKLLSRHDLKVTVQVSVIVGRYGATFFRSRLSVALQPQTLLRAAESCERRAPSKAATRKVFWLKLSPQLLR